MDAAQQSIAKRMKNVAFVPIENPVSIGDNLHFDTPTLRRFAEGYAKAYLDMTSAAPSAVWDANVNASHATQVKFEITATPSKDP